MMHELLGTTLPLPLSLAWSSLACACAWVSPISCGTGDCCGRPARYRPAPSAITARMPSSDRATRTQLEVRRRWTLTRDMVPVWRGRGARGGGGGGGGGGRAARRGGGGGP